MKETFPPNLTLRLPAPLRHKLDARLKHIHRTIGRVSRHAFALTLIEIGVETTSRSNGRREEGA